MGRLLFNLFNNAFYAVQQRRQQLNGNYNPSVSVSSKKLNGTIEIQVKDSGNGISQNIVDKIFQPFFTTKQTREGTGFGLTLSYDIIKSHGCELTVESNVKEGALF
jgi:two-component system NtrC family sensor kinase